MNDIFTSALFTEANLTLALKSIVAYLFIVWFCIIFWVFRDITNRTRSIIFQIFCMCLVFFLTPLGVFIYLLIRPQRTLFERIFEEEFLRLERETLAGESSQPPSETPVVKEEVVDIIADDTDTQEKE